MQAPDGSMVMDGEVAGIDEILAGRLVASQFPQWADLPVRPVPESGHDNRTFRLGDTMTVRLPSGPFYAQAVEKEQRWLPRLAAGLPVPIPAPLGHGRPDAGYPYPWSIYGWLHGAPATSAPIADLPRFAAALGAFLTALRSQDAESGPEPGEHNWWRAGPLAHYEGEAVSALDRLGDRVDQKALRSLWQRARSSTWDRPGVWVHGDIAVGNLLLVDGDLAAVIDFGSSGVGDPACDLVIAWTLFEGKSREAFRSAVGLDAASYDRARGWALWKSLIVLADLRPDDPACAEQQRVIARLLDDPAG